MGGEEDCENGGGDELIVAEAVDRNLWREGGGIELLCAKELRQCEQMRIRGGMLLAKVNMTMTITVLVQPNVSSRL